MQFPVEDRPDPLDIEFLETQIRREASAAMGLGAEVDLAIFVRDDGQVVAGISGWTWGDCCELQSLWVAPGLRGHGLATRLIAAAEAEAAARGCTQTVHFTYGFQARALYERNGYQLVGRVGDFPSGTDVLWYRKRLNPPKSPPGQERSRFEKPSGLPMPDPVNLAEEASNDYHAGQRRQVAAVSAALRPLANMAARIGRIMNVTIRSWQ